MSTDYMHEYKSQFNRTCALLRDGEWHDWTELRDKIGVRYGASIGWMGVAGCVIDTRASRNPKGKRQGMQYRFVEMGVPRMPGTKVFMTENDLLSVLDGKPTAKARIALADALGSYRENKSKYVSFLEKHARLGDFMTRKKSK